MKSPGCTVCQTDTRLKINSPAPSRVCLFKRCFSSAIFAVLFSSLFLTAAAHAAVQGYYRFPTIHGDQVVFMCEGDLWKVSTAGGRDATDIAPGHGKLRRTSAPMARWLAFTADYQGNGDVYVMPSDGGEPKRLTFHPSQRNCAGWTPDGKYVLFHRATQRARFR